MKVSSKPIGPVWFLLRVLLIAVTLICVHCVASSDEVFFYQGF